MNDIFNHPVTVPDMMDAREARFFMQQSMLKAHPGACLVCLGMNIAGPVKTTPEIEHAFQWGKESILAVTAQYSPLELKESHAFTGPEMMLCIAADADDIKKKLCDLEDLYPLGRLLDVDIIRPNGEKVSRSEVNRPVRRCLLCDRPAPECARSRSHSVEELFDHSHRLIREHFDRAFAVGTAAAAQRALLTEVAVSPKPGLVDRIDNGAHSDMDVFTFADSACVLGDYFRVCTETGLRFRGGDPSECFAALRTPGLLAEADMLRATGGVNTHKGAIFSLGIYCAALGMGFDGVNSDPGQALLRCGEMTAEAMGKELRYLDGHDAVTNGGRLYKRTGSGGVRAEAAGGFASVRTVALPMLKDALAHGLSVNDAALCALVALMASVPDTNVWHRGGEEGAAYVAEASGDLLKEISAWLSADRFDPAVLYSSLESMNKAMTAKRISPGGCADLLAMALMAYYSSSGRE